MSACRGCRAVVDGGRCCSSRRVSLHDDALPLALLSEGPRRPGSPPGPGQRRGRNPLGALATVGAVIVGLLIADVAPAPGTSWTATRWRTQSGRTSNGNERPLLTPDERWPSRSGPASSGST